jgi:hypothetical protein
MRELQFKDLLLRPGIGRAALERHAEIRLPAQIEGERKIR